MKDKLITIILTILIISVPIAMWTTSAKFNIPKLVLLLVGGVILLILMLSNYKKLTMDKKDYIILVFLLWGFVSTLHSGDYKASFIGTGNRYDGLLVICSYIIIYLCAKKFLIYKNNKTLLIILQIVYILVSVFGITQYYLKQPPKALYPILGKDVSGSFGNTNFMGSFISMGIPIFIISYIFKGNKISFITSLLTFFCLITCLARSGWVAFAIFTILLVIYLIKNRKKEYFFRLITLIVCFTLIFSGIYYSKGNRVKSKVKVMKNEIKTATTQGVQDTMGSKRINIWKISLELIQKYPILGVGTENMLNGVKENLTERSKDFIIKTKSIPDKAHNEYLHIAVTMGIPAAVLYLIFLALILLPKLKKMFNNYTLFIIMSVIISYSAQAFFNISTIGVAPLFWIALALVDNKNVNESKNITKINSN